jgi:2-C-methyl-D-erythritol 2,4-cyclodiphosphate synthase
VTVGVRIGIGHDTHRLGPDRPLVVGGVTVPAEFGPIGHSDGDVVLHSLVDAWLGALGEGDIGEHFPDHDPAHKDRDSAWFVEETRRRFGDRGVPVNVDVIIFLQQPKLSPYKQAIRERVATLVGLPAERVNVKAKTGERVGPVGTGQAIEAMVAVLIEVTD